VANGGQFDIIKNYPTLPELLAALEGLGAGVTYTPFECLWLLSFRTPPATAEHAADVH